MLHEDDPESGEGTWVNHADDKGPSKGMRSRANWPVSRRQVCWPPSNPEYVEVPPGSETNQVQANRAPVNHSSANQAPPLTANHASDNQVVVNRAPVNQGPAPRVPEKPTAPAPEAQIQAPILPPTGAKVPPPVPPRPANYPQVSMEVQQQALQQVNEQMQQQSSMMTSSSSSQQEVRSVSQSSSSYSQEQTYQATCTQQHQSFNGTHEGVVVQPQSTQQINQSHQQHQFMQQQEQLIQASSHTSSGNSLSMSKPTNSSPLVNVPIQNNYVPNTATNSSYHMNGNSQVVDSHNATSNTSQSQMGPPPVGFHLADPPKGSNQNGIYRAVPAQASVTTFGSTSGSTTVWPPKPEDLSDGPIAPPPNMTTQTQFPAGFKLRDQAPVQQTPPAMILSQPAFKITQPLKQKGENKWPPKDNGVVTQEQVREFTKPKGGKRDYSEFFAQNALPQTFNSYRAPPGTQHHGELDEEQTGLSEM